jgi:hypothetical protein
LIHEIPAARGARTPEQFLAGFDEFLPCGVAIGHRRVPRRALAGEDQRHELLLAALDERLHDRLSLCPLHAGPICSLCCTLERSCKDVCKTDAGRRRR